MFGYIFSMGMNLKTSIARSNMNSTINDELYSKIKIDIFQNSSDFADIVDKRLAQILAINLNYQP